MPEETMLPEEEMMAQPSPEMGEELSTDEAAASLALATKISQQMMMPQEEMEDEDITEEGEEPEEDDAEEEDGPEEEMMKEDLSKETRTIVREELDAFKSDLLKALDEEDKD